MYWFYNDDSAFFNCCLPSSFAFCSIKMLQYLTLWGVGSTRQQLKVRWSNCRLQFVAIGILTHNKLVIYFISIDSNLGI